MGGYRLEYLVADEADLDAAFALLVKRETVDPVGDSVWWISEPDTVAGKHDTYERVVIPEGAPSHLAEAQVGQGLMHVIAPDDSKWSTGPWLAYPVGLTEIRTETVTRTRGFAEPNLHQTTPEGIVNRDAAPGYVCHLAEAGWHKLTTAGERGELLGVDVTVEFRIARHTPVGDPTGWVFYGWVNG